MLHKAVQINPLCSTAQNTVGEAEEKSNQTAILLGIVVVLAFVLHLVWFIAILGGCFLHLGCFNSFKTII